MYHKYIGTSVANFPIGKPLRRFGIAKGVCPSNYYDMPKWYALASNNNKARGVLPLRDMAVMEQLPGGCFDYTDGDIPSPVFRTLADYKSRARSTREEFEKQRAAGVIVVNAMVAETSSLTLIPGLHGDVTPGSLSTFSVRPKSEPVGGEETDPCNGYHSPGHGWTTSLGGIPLDTPLWGSPGITERVDRRYQRYSGGYAALPPAHIGYEAYSKVHELLGGPRNNGLVTAVVAEANSGIMDVLTEVGEAKETIGYIFGGLRSIIELVVKVKRDLRRAKTRPGASAKEIASEIASIWMQFRYAVSPIGYSINDSLDLLQSTFTPYQTFRQGTSTKTDVELSDGWVLKDFEFTDRVWLKYQFSADTRVRGMKLNPFATAWELIPLSFVVDWVLNIGDMLSALQTPAAVSQTACTYSRQVRERSFRVEHVSGMYGHIELNMRYYRTQPINPLSHIGLNIDPSMSWKRWLDAISLSWLLSKDLLKTK